MGMEARGGGSGETGGEEFWELASWIPVWVIEHHCDIYLMRDGDSLSGQQTTLVSEHPIITIKLGNGLMAWTTDSVSQ
jgi:hypothetical protein